MSGIDINIEADVRQAQRYLKDIEGNGLKVQRAVLAGVGTSTKNAVKKDFKHHLHKRSGELYKGVKRKVAKKGDAVFIGAWTRGPNNVFYGHALANGSEIKAKNDKYLVFQVDGKWVKKQSVKLPERDWVKGPAMAYINSPKYQQQLDKIMSQQIRKIEKKRGWKK